MAAVGKSAVRPCCGRAGHTFNGTGRRRRLPAAWVLAGLVAAHACAGSAAAQATGERKWEVAVSGGGGVSARPAGGTALPIEPGAPFTTVVGEASRRVRSWFFGDGAALLNEAIEGFRDHVDVPPIDPLDDVLATGGLLRPHTYGGGAGFSVTRIVNRRFAVEFGGSYNTYPRIEMPVATRDRITESRESFEPTWAALMRIGPFADSTVSSTDTHRDGRLRELAVTGALQVTFPTAGRAAPYASLGAGYVQVSGELVSSELVGTYRFRLHGEDLFEQVDAVTLRVSSSGVLVGVVGAGVKSYLSDRWGLRLDARALIGPSATYLEVDTDPRVRADDLAGAIASRTAPSLQFGNTAAGSTLGLATRGLRTWSASGVSVRVRVAVGVFWRF